MNTNNNNYNGENKRTLNALKAENGGAGINIIESTKGKTYKDSTTKMLFFSCAGTTGYITKRVAEGFNSATDKGAFLDTCLAVDHQVIGSDGQPTTLTCIEVDSPNAVFTY